MYKTFGEGEKLELSPELLPEFIITYYDNYA